jgi:hypothetical protein
MVNFQGDTLLKPVNFQGNHLGCPESLPDAQLFETASSEKDDTRLEIRSIVSNFIDHRWRSTFANDGQRLQRSSPSFSCKSGI